MKKTPMMTIGEALEGITSATCTQWVEHTTKSGKRSRKRWREHKGTVTRDNVRFLVENQHLYGAKRRHIPGTPLPARIVDERDEMTRFVITIEYHRE